jgi:hypothetical protein
MLGISMVLFLPLYLVSFWTGGRSAVLCILAACGFGMLWAPHNSGAGTFFIFAAGMCGRLAPGRNAPRMLALVLALATADRLPAGGERPLLPAGAVGDRPVGGRGLDHGRRPARLAQTAAAQAGRGRAHRPHRRARTHLARPARFAGPFAVLDRAEGRTGGQAGRARPRRLQARDRRYRSQRAPRPGRGEDGGDRLPRQRPVRAPWPVPAPAWRRPASNCARSVQQVQQFARAGARTRAGAGAARSGDQRGAPRRRHPLHGRLALEEGSAVLRVWTMATACAPATRSAPAMD